MSGPGPGELVVGRLHQFGVKRPGDASGTTFMAPSSVAIGSTCSRAGSFARDDDVARAEQVGLPEPAERRDPAAQLVDGRLVEAQDAGHAAGRGQSRGLHRLTAPADHLEPRLEIHRAGEDQGGVFAQAKPGGTLAGGDDFGIRSALRLSSAARLATKIAG